MVRKRRRRSGVRRFKTKAGYRRWLAYGHMRTRRGTRAKSRKRSVFATTRGHQRIYIRGKRHHVKHRRKRR